MTPVPNASGSSAVVAKTWPSAPTCEKPAARRRAPSVRGSDGCVRCSSHARSTRSMRSGSSECQLTVAPVDVPHHDAPARTQRATHLRERRRGVGDVLEDLHAQRGVEARLLDGQRRRVALAEVDVGVAARSGARRRRACAGWRRCPRPLPPAPTSSSSSSTKKPGPQPTSRTRSPARAASASRTSARRRRTSRVRYSVSICRARLSSKASWLIGFRSQPNRNRDSRARP